MRNKMTEIPSFLSLNSVVEATRQQVSSDLADELVILNVANGRYFGLDSVGAQIWRLIQEPQSVRGIRDHILDEYDVAADQCERDVLALLEDLEAAGLIEVRNARRI